MAKNRKGFEDFILTFMGKVTKGGGNRIIYERLFKAMNDKQFEEFMVKLEEIEVLAIWGSNNDPNEMIDWENLKKLAKEYNVSLEQRLVIYDEETGIKSMTPYTAIVGTDVLRKQRQMWVKKFSAAKDDTKIDDLTGQVMGDSRSTGISQPEITVLRNLGLTTMANELYNVKGGDQQALRAYKNDILTTGKTNTNSSLERGDIAKVLKTAYYLLRARGIDNNMNSRN
jgi:hypothetical protein